MDEPLLQIRYFNGVTFTKIIYFQKTLMEYFWIYVRIEGKVQNNFAYLILTKLLGFIFTVQLISKKAVSWKSIFTSANVYVSYYHFGKINTLKFKLTSHGILHYLWSTDLSKSFSKLILPIVIFSRYFSNIFSQYLPFLIIFFNSFCQYLFAVVIFLIDFARSKSAGLPHIADIVIH